MWIISLFVAFCMWGLGKSICSNDRREVNKFIAQTYHQMYASRIEMYENFIRHCETSSTLTEFERERKIKEYQREIEHAKRINNMIV